MDQQGRKTILLVEDDRLISAAGKRTLERLGYQAFVANAGESAVGLFEGDCSVDLVLMDIDLGTGIDGTEAAARMLAHRDIPVVFMSSHTEREIVEKTEKITSYGYVVKNSSDTALDASLKMAFKLFDSKMAELAKEEALKRSEESFERLFRDSPYPIMMIDAANGLFHDVNEALLANVEYSREELIGRSAVALGIITPEIEAETRGLIMRNGAYKGLEISVRTKSGKIRYGMAAGQVLVIDGRPCLVQTIMEITESKLALEALKESEFKYRSIIEFSSDIVFCVDRQGQYRFVNKVFASAFGKTPGYFEGKTFWDIYPKGHADRRMDIVERLFRTGERESFEIEVPIGGEILYFASTINPISDDEGNIILALTHGRDITERKRMEGNLRESDSKYRLLFENSPLGIAYFDREGIIIAANDGLERIIGVPKRKSVGLKLLELPDKRLHSAVMAAIAGRTGLYEGEYHSVTVEKVTPIRALFAPLRVEEGKVLGGIGIIEDHSGQRRMETALRDSESKYRSYVENVSDGIFVTDEQGRYVEVNPAASLITGYSREELLTMSIMDFQVEPQHASLPERSTAAFKAVRETGMASVERRFKRRDGALRWWSIDAVKLNPTRMLAITKDITDRKRDEERIHSLLGEKDLRLSEIHHRVKNSMNTISALLEIQSRSMADPVAVDALEDAGRRVRSMLLLYDKLYRSSTQEAVSSRDYLGSLVDEVVANFPNAAQVEVRKEIGDCLLGPRILQPLGIIVNELITNAMKHAFTPGERGTLRVSMVDAAPRFRLVVQDDGRGLTDETLAATEGFGLTLVRNLAAQLGGSATFEGGSGMTATIEFGA